MTKFFNKLKKNPCFWPIFVPFSQFWGQKFFFPENLDLSHTISCWLASCQNLEKTNDTTPRKHPDRWKDRGTNRRKDGMMDGRTLQATIMDLKRKVTWTRRIAGLSVFYLFQRSLKESLTLR